MWHRNALISTRMSFQIRKSFSPICALYKASQRLTRLYPSYSALKYCCVIYLSFACFSSRPRSVSVPYLLLGLACPCIVSRIVTHRRSYLQTLEEYIFSDPITAVKTYGTKLERIVPSATATMRALYEDSRSFRPQYAKDQKSKWHSRPECLYVGAHHPRISLSPCVDPTLPATIKA